MSRYIDADPLVLTLETNLSEEEKQLKSLSVNDFITMIGERKTEDVVPVVKCKDCMYGVQEELFDLDGVNHRSMEWHCVKNDLSVVDDWFCADGESTTGQVNEVTE